ncbi:MAG: pyruvate synthase, partial [Anaerolineae bacterium]|nr:pyruvate synthase [Anaerolineae bacterium]
DPTILRIVNVTEGLKENGIVLINTAKTPAEVRSKYGVNSRLALVDASKIALETLRIPVTNTTMLGAL